MLSFKGFDSNLTQPEIEDDLLLQILGSIYQPSPEDVISTDQGGGYRYDGESPNLFPNGKLCNSSS